MNQADYELYGWNTPNGQKIVIALEEVGVAYTYHPIDISQGQQHTESFRNISPDGKIPALVHHAGVDITLFESGAILLYLANQFPILHGNNKSEQAQVLSWTFWQVGQLGPLAGQFGRFQTASPANPKAVEHFNDLVWRCLEVMEKRLTDSTFLACDRFTVADIASFPWIASEQSYLQRYNVMWRERCPALRQWADRISQRPSVVKALDLGPF